MDRLICQAILQVLTPVFDPNFSEGSFGFRPGRSAHRAVDTAGGFAAAGGAWVVAVDRVNHDALMARVARRWEIAACSSSSDATSRPGSWPRAY